MKLFTQLILSGALMTLSVLPQILQAQIAEAPFTVIEQKSRPADHFTQGLYFDGERWLESSGLYGRSWLAEYTDPGANPIRRKWLDSDRFAEGLAVHNNKLYLLTYRAGELLVFERKNFAPLESLNYSGEGWGLTSDGQQLIMSNGSDTLTFRDPSTFVISRSLRVHGGGVNWRNLNELEFAHGLIWANLWQDPRIIAIDPTSGQVKGVLNLKSLAPPSPSGKSHPDAVANGIAWDQARNGLWVTGKYWPSLTLIRPRGFGFSKDSGAATNEKTGE